MPAVVERLAEQPVGPPRDDVRGARGHQLVAAGAPVLTVGPAHPLDHPLAVGRGLGLPPTGRAVDVGLDVLHDVSPQLG